MFKKNDKALYRVRGFIKGVLIVINVLAIFVGLICILISFDSSIIEAEAGILMQLQIPMQASLIACGIFLILVIPIISVIVWMFYNLLFSFMIDVKLIRNKLYGENNSQLDDLAGKK